MSILSGHEIRKQIDAGNITIDPFDESLINPASINVRLGKTLRYYDEVVLDMHKKPRIREVEIPDTGFEMRRGEGYLGCTIEIAGSCNFVPILDGRSTGGRFFLLVHFSAGFGDPSFLGQWTLEMMSLARPLRVYTGDQIAQIRFQTLQGEVMPYKGRYQGQQGPTEAKPL